MRSRLYLNAALLLLLGGLAAVVFFDAKKTTLKPTLASIAIDKIKRIQIKQKGQQAIVLQLDQQQWQITSPFKARASASKVERLLKIPAIPSQASYPLEKADKERFGLAQPTIELSFNDQLLSLGKVEPVNFRRYIAHENSMMLVDDTFMHLLSAPASSLVDTRIIPENAQITQISSPQFDLVINDNNRWRNRLASSEEPSLSSDDVQAFLDEWRFARATSVSLNKNSPSPLQKEDILITLDNTKQLHFILQTTKSGATLSPPKAAFSYHISSKKRDQLLNFPASP